MVSTQQLLEALVSLKFISQEQAEGYRSDIVEAGQDVKDFLLRKNIVSEVQYEQARAQVLGVPFVTLAGKGFSPEVTNFIPEPVARRYTLFPFDYDAANNTIFVAMQDPFDLQVIEFLEQKNW